MWEMNILVPGVTTLLFSIVSTYYFSKIGLKYGFTGIDNFKSNHPRISTLGGYALFISTVVGVILLWIFNIISIKLFLASILSLIIVATVGFLDDYVKDLPGYFKPATTLLAGIPFIVFHTYTPSLRIFGDIGFHLPIVYPLLILVAFSVVTNSVNMLDVINGSATIGSLFTLIAITIGYYIRSYTYPPLPILFMLILLGFFIFNFYPAKIFLGNMGSLLLGYYIVLSAIIYRCEFPALVAMFPFIHNSFFYLNKVKGFIEHKRLKARVTNFDDKHELIYDACDPNAPITLLRFIVCGFPKSEFEAFLSIAALFLVSFLLSILTVIWWG